MHYRHLLVAVLLTGLVGCSTTPDLAPPPAPAATVTVSPEPADSPVRLAYPALGLDTPLSPTGLNPDGTITVPPLALAAEVDYLRWAPTIAAGRPLVLLSHVNGRDPAGQVIPGGFVKLSGAKLADRITVTTAAGAAVGYVVTSSREVSKAAFPSEVYRVRATPTLVLITCGGVIDRTQHSYLSNRIVEAEAL